MMTTHQFLLLYTSSSLSLLVHFCQAQPHCTPSACGIITLIQSPFRLKGDPHDCGDRMFELACDNNVTSIYLNSHKYYVKAINYANSSIRLVDASVKDGDICSFPNYSAYRSNFPHNYDYYNSLDYPYLTPEHSYHDQFDIHTPISFISCPLLLNNSSLFTESRTDCASQSQRYAYIKVGHINASEMPQTCKYDLVVMTSWKFMDLNNVSLSEIHSSLLYGFELDLCSWCPTTKWDRFAQAFYSRRLNWVCVIIIVTAVVGPVMMMIIVFTGGLGVLSYSSFNFEPDSYAFVVLHIGTLLIDDIASIYSTLFSQLYTACIGNPTVFIFLHLVSVAITAPRFFMFPLALWLLIYKFRRRHLSLFEGIESYLRSDNKLTPIRYSYSDIKKMTRGFQEKLGEGGYGCVYKGKLRSGNDVAVKLLGKSGANGQDFMNEIATIGRIHHVNVVKLVGYCVERSKRALVFDFMPNGSLEKFLFNQEKMNFLSWDTKFDIAVGVARGIEYLHRGCDVQILHFDIKPHNVLLDDNFIPKISDFGLAKYFSTEKTSVTLTAARGTIGYVAPELINRGIGRVSYKADVYSFGMLLMEMVGLNRVLKGNNGDSSQYFPCWIYDHFNQGKDIEIGNNDSTSSVGRKMTIVALWCIRMSPHDRPSMNKVLEMLEADVDRLQIPEYPSQSTQIGVNVNETEYTCSSDSVSLLHHDDASSSVEIIVRE